MDTASMANGIGGTRGVDLRDTLRTLAERHGSGLRALEDVQRLFAGDASDPARIAALAEQAFERCAERTSAKRDECALSLHGFDIDPAPLEACFGSVTALASSVSNKDGDTAESFARRLLEYVQ